MAIGQGKLISAQDFQIQTIFHYNQSLTFSKTMSASGSSRSYVIGTVDLKDKYFHTGTLHADVTAVTGLTKNTQIYLRVSGQEWQATHKFYLWAGSSWPYGNNGIGQTSNSDSKVFLNYVGGSNPIQRTLRITFKEDASGTLCNWSFPIDTTSPKQLSLVVNQPGQTSSTFDAITLKCIALFWVY